MGDEHQREEARGNPDVDRAAERLAGQPERPDVAPDGAALDERLRKSPRSPNDLDQSDESRKAADIRRAAEAEASRPRDET